MSWSRIRAGVVVQADLDIPGRIKFAKMPESPCQRYGLLRLPKVTERRDGPRPGDSDDDDDDDDDDSIVPKN